MAIRTLAVLAFILYSAVRLGAGQTCQNIATWPLSSPLPYDVSLTSANPLGFGTFTSFNSETFPPNPCVSVTASNNKYILVSVQVTALITNSRICVRQNGEVAGSCGSGFVIYCAQVVNSNPTVVFYCDSSCDIADVSYYYRVNVSDVTVTQDEYWCDTYRAVAESNLPSSLLAYDPLATQSAPLFQVGSAPSATPTLLVIMAVSLFAAIFLYTREFV
ncbi:hypothetical protein EMCRGX_G001405 [Ephydatia muelleri]|eukprot:Em0001g1334a